MIDCEFNSQKKFLTCRFRGRMDGAASREAEEAIGKKIEVVVSGGTAIEDLMIDFDLAGVDYVSSGFLRICLATAKKTSAGKFGIVNTSPFVRKIFKTSGLERVLNVR